MLEPDNTYHLYNRANGSENLFREEKNFHFFMERYFRYIDPIAETLVYCLMPNHFHVMIRTRKRKEIKINLKKSYNLKGVISNQFSKLFNSYAKAYNKMYQRHGSLFQRPFKFKIVDDPSYFTELVLYIHKNPVKHGFVKKAIDWPYSSIHQYFSAYNQIHQGLNINPKQVIDWFGDINEFKNLHQTCQVLDLTGLEKFKDLSS